MQTAGKEGVNCFTMPVVGAEPRHHLGGDHSDNGVLLPLRKKHALEFEHVQVFRLQLQLFHGSQPIPYLLVPL